MYNCQYQLSLWYANEIHQSWSEVGVVFLLYYMYELTAVHLFNIYLYGGNIANVMQSPKLSKLQ